jgi:D-amino peptidase
VKEQEETLRRLYISADIEGVAGVVNVDQAGSARRDYGHGRQWMTNEVLAACEAAHDAGIEQIIVSDSHGTGDNILIDQLPDYVQVVRSWPRELMMVQGVECGSFVGAAFLGYHASSRAESGIMAHTFTGDIIELKLNGVIQSETTFNAAVIGEFGVPLIMASGDDIYAEHIEEVMSDVECATVKWAHGDLSARTLTPQAACALIGEKLTAALKRADAYTPARIDGPIEMEIQTGSRFKAEACSYIPTVERISSHRIRLSVRDMIEASRFINLYIQIKNAP